MVLGERSKKTLKAHADIFRALSLIMLMHGYWSSQEKYIFIPRSLTMGVGVMHDPIDPSLVVYW